MAMKERTKARGPSRSVEDGTSTSMQTVVPSRAAKGGGARRRRARGVYDPAFYGRLRRLEVAVATLLSPTSTNLRSDELDALARRLVQPLLDAYRGQSPGDGPLLPLQRTPEGETPQEGSSGSERQPTLREKVLAALAEASPEEEVE